MENASNKNLTAQGFDETNEIKPERFADKNLTSKEEVVEEEKFDPNKKGKPALDSELPHGLEDDKYKEDDIQNTDEA